ncbi:MAG: hypothetical protein HFF01_07795 [Erysipelotrichaceae bacterium]|nr:hypothetical protein [Erysipelotrichaceae bacterium]MCI9524927.1 hypothetical protein [Erysipelotrichaceae bacterium]
MKSFEVLREKYPLFRYNAYHMEESEQEWCFWYDFEIVGLDTFHPKWSIDKTKIKHLNVHDEVVQKLIFSIGMVELSSYWKLTCSPCVEIYAAALNDEQIAWWKKQYYLGLGEFFYTNGIHVEMDAFMHIKTPGNSFSNIKGNRELHGCLIPIGGGKDSAVTLELMKQSDEKLKCYIINGRGATKDTVETAGMAENDVICVKRTLDAHMLELNKQGYLNGHTPFSALVAFSSTLFAYLNDLQYVVLSNEDSANESTVAGTQINHQYSKSFQFEKDFRDYEQLYIGSNVLYFSLLRGWSEYQIAQCFAQYPQYFPIFRSCNVGSKQDVWCGNCPKCLFVFLILCPFIELDEEIRIFQKNLLEKELLIDTLEKLVGYQSEKPFECVGSREEINIAICEKIQRMEKKHESLPLLFRHYQTLPQYRQYYKKNNPYTHYFNEENLIPKQFLKLVKEGMKNAAHH